MEPTGSSRAGLGKGFSGYKECWGATDLAGHEAEEHPPPKSTKRKSQTTKLKDKAVKQGQASSRARGTPKGGKGKGGKGLKRDSKGKFFTDQQGRSSCFWVR